MIIILIISYRNILFNIIFNKKIFIYIIFTFILVIFTGGSVRMHFHIIGCFVLAIVYGLTILSPGYPMRTLKGISHENPKGDTP